MGKLTLSIATLTAVMVAAGAVPHAIDKKQYKLILKDRVIFGTLEGAQFEGCNGIPFKIPPGAQIERTKAPCPSDDDGQEPFAGHGKIETPKPKASPRA